MSSTQLAATVLLSGKFEEDETSNEAYRRRKELEPRTMDDYIIIEELGRGAQGIVYIAARKSDRRCLALKVLNIRPGSSQYNTALEEINALEEISNPRCSPYLVCYYGHSYDPEKKVLLIEMECIIGDTLDKYTKRLYEHREYEKLYRHLVAIAKDIAKGLKVVHNKGIIHSDIKPENILIDTNLVPKLVDFGIACRTGIHQCTVKVDSTTVPIDCCKEFGGTPYYMPPESIDNIRYKSSDIWSLGVTLYKSATGGRLPFDYPEEINLGTILRINASQDPKILRTGNKILDYIVNNSLKSNPTDRITPEQIVSVSNK